jgi:hypothetical protein
VSQVEQVAGAQWAAPAQAPMSRDDALTAWQTAQMALKAAQIAEVNLRRLIFEMCFTDPKEGMNTLDLGLGYELKADNKFNYTLDKVKIGAVLDAIEALGERGTLISERLVKFSPQIAVGEYRKLSAEDASATDKQIKSLIDGVLTVKPGLPALEIKAPPAA